jgi:hypothetical protein
MNIAPYDLPSNYFWERPIQMKHNSDALTGLNLCVCYQETSDC